MTYFPGRMAREATLDHFRGAIHMNLQHFNDDVVGIYSVRDVNVSINTVKETSDDTNKMTLIFI